MTQSPSDHKSLHPPQHVLAILGFPVIHKLIPAHAKAREKQSFYCIYIELTNSSGLQLFYADGGMSVWNIRDIRGQAEKKHQHFLAEVERFHLKMRTMKAIHPVVQPENNQA